MERKAELFMQCILIRTQARSYLIFLWSIVGFRRDSSHSTIPFQCSSPVNGYPPPPPPPQELSNGMFYQGIASTMTHNIIGPQRVTPLGALLFKIFTL